MNRIVSTLKYFSLALVFTMLSAISFADADGVWTKKAQKIKGSWSIEQTDTGAVLTLSEDFKTRNAPDLKLMLSKQLLSEANGKNALTNAILIAPLKSNKGGQSYPLPDDYKDYDTLLLHCEKFSKLWGGATIQ